MGLTGGVLPILVHRDWQVETVWLDRDDGLREWIEVRHGERIYHCESIAELHRLLHQRGLDLAEFREVDTVDDGCE
ncbi:hypothetical protein [Plantactinospora sp. CA-290183]|uniref:hypothetical protein n=1 Tax=Plantactinospora sp. CA-290183 TaxID=3240006 RepID=UPI003D8F81EB